MSSFLNSGSDYDLLKDNINTIILRAKIIERDDRFTIAETGNSLLTIPNDHIVRITRDNEDIETGLAEIRIKQSAKILRKTLVTASDVSGIISIGSVGRQGGTTVLCTQCCTQCCEQCCTQCCEQCCTQCASVDYPGMDVSNPSTISGGVFRRVTTQFG